MFLVPVSEVGKIGNNFMSFGEVMSLLMMVIIITILVGIWIGFKLGKRKMKNAMGKRLDDIEARAKKMFDAFSEEQN